MAPWTAHEALCSWKLQAIILELVAIFFSRVSSQHIRDRTCKVSLCFSADSVPSVPPEKHTTKSKNLLWANYPLGPLSGWKTGKGMPMSSDLCQFPSLKYISQIFCVVTFLTSQLSFVIIWLLKLLRNSE